MSIIDRRITKAIKDKHLNNINSLYLIVFFLFVSASFLQYFFNISRSYAIFNLICGVIFLSAYLLRKKINENIRIIISYYLVFIHSIWAVIHSGFAGTGILTFYFLLLISVLFMSKKRSIITGITIIIILTAIGILAHYRIIKFYNAEEILYKIQSWFIIIFSFSMITFFSASIFYFLKNQLLETITSLHSSNKELTESLNRIDRLAFYDTLTGLPNRNFLEREITEQVKNGSCGFIIYMNLKSFWNINTIYGAEAGLRIINKIEESASGLLQSGEALSRIGNYTFGWWIKRDSTKTLENIEEFSILYKQSIKRTFGYDIELSWGYTEIKNNSQLKTAFENAELALTKAKLKNSREPVLYDSAFAVKITNENILLDQLKKSISDGSFDVVYQPKVLTSDGSIVGVEALARWKDKTGVNISPEIFIPLLTNNQLIVPFSKIIFEKVMLEFPLLRNKYGDEIKVSFNASPPYLFIENLLVYLEGVTKEYAINPEKIVIEITEDIFIEDINFVSTLVKSLREMGFGISLDDFGKGYSSIYYLSQIDFTEIKIDRAFIHNIDKDKRVESLVKTTCNMAQNLGMTAVAEGVETEFQLNTLKRIGCEVVQGYLFYRPEPLF